MRLQAGGTASSGSVVPELTELASGVDALYVSGHGTLSPSLLRVLPEHRARAEQQGEAVPIAFGDGGWVVDPRGWLRYRYSLRHEHGQLGISDKESLPPLRMQPLSEFMHGIGPEAALDWFEEQAAEAVQSVRLTAARLDVYADWQGWMPCADDLDDFVRRAAYSNTRASNGTWMGFDFGLRKSGTVMARLYDKARQVRDEGKDWWLDVWGDRYDPSSPVLRVEFELGRKGLQEYGIDAAQEALERSARLWTSITDKWLTHRVPTGDETRSRWPVSSTWRQVQRPSFAENSVGLDRIRRGKNAGSLRTMTPALVGYVAKAGALLGTTNLEDTLELLHEHIWTACDVRGVTFEERLREKVREVAA
jgi:hypothetical protein